MIKSYSPHFLTDHILEQSVDMICTIDRDGKFVYVNKACENILGFESRNLIGRSSLDFIHPEDHKNTDFTRKEVVSGNTTTFENRLTTGSGKELLYSWSAVWSDEENVLICIGRDVTEQMRAGSKVREKEDLFQALIEHGSDMLALLDAEGNYKYNGDSYYRILGYQTNQLVGLNAFELMHPADIPKALNVLNTLLKEGGHSLLSDFRYKNAAGEWRWLETIGSNQLNNPNIGAIVISSRDITESKIAKLKLIESEQRFKSMFENNPDMVYFENKEGLILDVNPAVLSYYGVEKDKVVGYKMSDFLPADAALLCDHKRLEALAGSKVQFELELVVSGFENIGTITLDLSKFPVEVDGEVVGIYTIARDITAIKKSQNIIRQQAIRLSNIFESITDAFFTIDLDWHFTYINGECERLTNIDRHGNIGKNIWEIFKEEVGGVFHQKYQHAFDTGESVQFTAFFKRNNQWLDVKAFPFNEGLSVYFADVTDRVQAEQKLEKLSLVASQTTNGVLIMNPEFKIEWINEGFTKLTGYSFKESAGKTPIELLGHGQTDYNRINLIRNKMNQGEPVAFEILNRSKENQDIWLSVEENPIFGKNGEITGFVSTQTDITALKKSELELTQLTKDLYRHNRDMQQFTYIVSHNLRSPVANVIGLTQLLNKVDKNSEAFDKSLVNLKKSVTQLDQVLKDMNTILSVKDVKETFNKEEVELNQVLQQVLESLQEPLTECKGELFLNIPVDYMVTGNRAYLHSIFYNLLSNAIKYRSPERTLQVTISCLSHESGETVISFSDNGLGFDMDRVGSKLFKLYTRFHSSAAEGRGIGLFLVKTHVEAMGGRIEVDSKVNTGTTFTIYTK